MKCKIAYNEMIRTICIDYGAYNEMNGMKSNEMQKARCI